VDAAVEVTIPGGVAVDGGRRRDAALRPVAGADEAFLLDADALAPVERSTLLLSRCLVRLGPWGPPGEDDVRALAAGDREALLLQLRRLTLGDRVDLVLSCPACEEALGLDLSVGDLLVPPYDAWAAEHSVAVAGERISFRLPTGGDLEAAARVGAVDPGRGARLVLDRCVLGLDGGGAPAAELSPAAADAVAARMAELDPQAEIVLEMPCAVCGHVFTVPLDAGALLARELADRGQLLLHEIHLLALHYGWPESELLEMGTRRRRRYVAYLAEAVGR
jgi:hypothetical protein